MVMKKSDRKADAHAFLDWLLSPRCRGISVGLDWVR